jgi:hypothetical protein
MRYSMLLVMILLSVYSWYSASAQARQVMKYSVVFSDSSNITHFRDEEIPWETQQVSYSRLAALITPFFLDAEKIGFLRLPRGSTRIDIQHQVSGCHGL